MKHSLIEQLQELKKQIDAVIEDEKNGAYTSIYKRGRRKQELTTKLARLAKQINED